MAEMDTQHVVTAVVTWTLTTLSFMLSNSLALLTYSYANYPEFTKIALMIVIGYVVYKFSVKIITIWLRLIIAIVKSFLIFMTIAIVFLLYLRGWDRLINQDLPYLKVIIEGYRSGELSSKGGWFTLLFNNPQIFNQENIKSTLNNFANEDINSYFEYFDKNFNSENGDDSDMTYERIQNLVNEGMERLESSGFDFEEMGNNIMDYLNNYQ